MNVIHRYETIVLLDHACGPLIELFGIFRAPPVIEVTSAVELAAFIIETVREFVANDSSGIAIVHCVIHVVVVKRRLKNSGRKINVVHLRAVISVNRWRAHAPLSSIHRLADLGDLPMSLKLSTADVIAKRIS